MPEIMGLALLSGEYKPGGVWGHKLHIKSRKWLNFIEYIEKY